MEELDGKLSDNVNTFIVRDNRVKNSEMIIANIGSVINHALAQNNNNIQLALDKNIIRELPDHLKDVVIDKEMPHNDRNKLIGILIEFQDVFYKPGDPINTLKLIFDTLLD